MEKEEFLKILLELSNKIGVTIAKSQAQQFYEYMMLLLQWNQNINLTAIVEPKEIILKHFIDSIMLYRFIEEKDKKIIDIGTGAGFPGLPLKILYPEKEIILLDSLQKRINFLEEVKNKLQLKEIQCLHGRAEELAKNRSYRENFDISVSRAVARLNVLVEYMLPFTKVGGKCICMKGPKSEEELEEAKHAIEILGGEIQNNEKIFLPETDMQRNYIVIKKVKNTPKQYPRKAGMPLKKPII